MDVSQKQGESAVSQRHGLSDLRWYFAYFVVSGFCGLVYEIVWLRLAMASFGVTTALASIVISMFMTGLGLGSWGGEHGRAVFLSGMCRVFCGYIRSPNCVSEFHPWQFRSNLMRGKAGVITCWRESGSPLRSYPGAHAWAPPSPC